MTAEYFSEHVSHVCMEPLNATVRVDGDKVEVWAGNQAPAVMQILASIGAGTTPDKVSVHTQLLGGGFGRRSDGDDVLHAAMLAKAVAGPSGEDDLEPQDDMQNDKFRPLTAQRIEIGLDAKGDIVGWRHRIVNETYLGRVLPPPVFKAIGMHDVVSGGGGDMSYDGRQSPRRMGAGQPRRRRRCVARHRRRLHQVRDRDADRRARRSARSMDPVAYRLEMLKDDPRAAAVVKAVAEMAKWGEKRQGRAVGIAYLRRAAQPYGGGGGDLARQEDRRDQGPSRLGRGRCRCRGAAEEHRGADESAMIFGLGAALREQIHIKDGVVQERNFDGYQVCACPTCRRWTSR